MKINPTIVKSVLLIVAAVVLFMLPGLKLPYIDNNTDTYFSDAMTKAGVAYGVCRVVNASVSAIKESQIQIEPAGLGVSLAVGQVLDPLDDMTERASDILVTAIVSIGIQKIVYELCVAFVPSLIGFAIIVLFGISFVKGDRATTLRGLVVSSIILLAVARLFLPISSIINTYLQENYFSPQIIKVQDELAMNSPEMERLKDMSMPEIDGVFGTVKNGFDFVGEKTSDLGTTLKAMVGNMESMVSNLLKLSYLYVAVFIVQVIILPVGAFWLLTRITNVLFGAGLTYTFKNSDVETKMSKSE
ncbi:MAG: hypothetical protein KJ826_06260 [Proteobacteria bacterium]|nr:hypothetical protein [Desulfobacula sp.]MBU3947809.1 hypothetical protein [Pseudomonadota bacterium]